MINKLIKNKKGYAIQIFVVIGIIAGLITILSTIGLINVAGLLSYDMVYKQNWGHYCCVQHDDYDIDFTRYMDDKTFWKCDDYTNECLFTINPDRDFSFLAGAKSFKYSICDLNGLSCSSPNKQIFYATVKQTDTKTITIDSGKSIKFSNTALSNDMRYLKVNKKVKTFYLKGMENGKVYQQESCILSSELRRKTITDGKNELSFDECQNYMIDFIQVATKTYSYQGQEVICQARQLYQIDNERFKDGVLRKIQGERITSVECCPTENNCGDDFVFQQITERDCTYSSECANGGDLFPVSQVTAGQYSCVSGICEYSEVNVECTSTAVCIQRYGEGYVCDLSPNNWGVCKQSTTPFFCGDGYCDVGETRDNCPSDCMLECLPDEKLVTEKKKVNCNIGFPLYIGCDEVIEYKCVKTGTNWIVIIIIASFLAVLFFFRNQIWTVIKTIGGKLGI